MSEAGEARALDPAERSLLRSFFGRAGFGGPPYGPGAYLFGRALGLAALAAFHRQLDGLVGARGILPAEAAFVAGDPFGGERPRYARVRAVAYRFTGWSEGWRTGRASRYGRTSASG